MQEDILEVRADGQPRERREYSEAFKRRIVASTFEPGASVSRIAQRQGLNTNLVFAWRRDGRYRPGTRSAALLPVRVVEAMPASQVCASEVDMKPAYIEVEVRAAKLRLHGAVDMDVVAGVFALIEGRQ